MDSRRKSDKKKSTQKVQEDDRTVELIVGILAILFGFPFYALYFSYKIIFWIFFRIPNKASPFYGLLRSGISFAIINHFDGRGLSRSFSDCPFQIWFEQHSLGTVWSIFLFACDAGLIISFLNGLLVIGGINKGLTITADDQVSPFENIKTAFLYREGVMEQQSTKGKMEEMAKLAFATNAQMQNPATPSEKEALFFLDSVLEQQSTSGKYEKLKELYGNKK